MRGRSTTVASLIAVALVGPVTTGVGLDQGQEPAGGDGAMVDTPPIARPPAPDADDLCRPPDDTGGPDSDRGDEGDPQRPDGPPWADVEANPATDAIGADPAPTGPGSDERPAEDQPAEDHPADDAAAGDAPADCADRTTPDDGYPDAPEGDGRPAPPAPPLAPPDSPAETGPGSTPGQTGPDGTPGDSDPPPPDTPSPQPPATPHPTPDPPPPPVEAPAPPTTPAPVPLQPAPPSPGEGIRFIAPEPGVLPTWGPEPIGVVLAVADGTSPVVELTDGRRTICRWEGPPYTCAWRPGTLEIGWFTLRAIATHSDGTESSARVSVQVPRHTPVGVTQLAWASAVRSRARVVTIGHVAPPPGLPTALACRGYVQVRVSRGTRTVGFQRVRLNRHCGFTSRLLTTTSIDSSDVLRVQAQFPGNAVMGPARPLASPVRTGSSSTPRVGSRGTLAGIAKAATGRAGGGARR